MILVPVEVVKNIRNAVELLLKKSLHTFVIPICIVILSILLYVLAFPPFKFGVLGFFFTIPFLIWADATKCRKSIWVAAIAIPYFSWFILLFWLRHVTWGGLIALAAIMTFFHTLWYLVAAKVFSKLHTIAIHYRVIQLCGLAALWTLLEWARGFIYTGLGFPWLTLATTQWNHPKLLQIASVTGAYGVSFFLIFFNVTIASIFLGFIHYKKKNFSSSVRYNILALLVAVAIVFLSFIKSLPQRTQEELLFKAAVIQPNIPGILKWEPGRFQKNLSVLKEETLKFAQKPVDVVIWPETALPAPIKGDEGMQAWTEFLVDEVHKPLWLGSLTKEKSEWYNSLAVVLPESGLENEIYSKRKRVLFGEYVPCRNWFPFLNKFIPVEWDIAAGEGTRLLKVRIHDSTLKMGGLVCFEDIFPELTRASVREGADFLLVVTNNAWYGEEWGAYQHAVHSILRAVESRRPFVRCGNAGWSGWIDEWGTIRQVAEKDATIYFRGSEIFEVFRNRYWANRLSFYTRYGDWFIGLCCMVIIFAFVSYKKNENKI